MIDKWIAEYIGLLIDEEDDKKVEVFYTEIIDLHQLRTFLPNPFCSTPVIGSGYIKYSGNKDPKCNSCNVYIPRPLTHQLWATGWESH